MSDIWDVDESTEQDDVESGPKALREAYEKLKKQFSEAKKEHQKLQADFKTLSTQTKASTLDGILREKGVPANVAKWLKRDDVEADVEAVDKWLAENGEDFGWKPNAQEQGQDSAAGDESREPTEDATLPPQIPGPSMADADQKLADITARFDGGRDFDALMKSLRDQGLA